MPTLRESAPLGRSVATRLVVLPLLWRQREQQGGGCVSSTSAFCDALPRRRDSYDAKGRILRLPRTGLVVVPFEQVGGGWSCVVVVGNDSYPRDGYCLFVSRVEIETAIELGVGGET